MKVVTEYDVEKLHIDAKAKGCRPLDMARYAQAKHEFEILKKSLFDHDKHIYTNSPADFYVERLAKEAESGDPDAVARYEIISKTVEQQKAKDDDFRDMRSTASDLRKLYADGGDVSDKHIRLAKGIAVRNPTAENMAMASLLSRRQAEQAAGTFAKPEAPEERKVTEDDVKAAYDKARKTSSTSDIARYSTLRQQYQAQQEVKDNE